MTRILVVLLAAFLLLAPAAMAKGPHVVMTTAQEPAPVGKPWVATLEFNEFRGVPGAQLIAIRGDRRVSADVRRVTASMEGAAGFKTRLTFPEKGRWQIRVVAGKHRFRFPAVDAGGTEIVLDYVAFPMGSMAARQGGGGVYMEEEPVGSGPDTALPAEVITYADLHPEEDDGGGGLELWMFPLAGVVLAGAGVLTLRRRR
jgi:hypothetical protein